MAIKKKKAAVKHEKQHNLRAESLIRIARAVENEIAFWGTNTNDPYKIKFAVLTSLSAVVEALQAEAEHVRKLR